MNVPEYVQCRLAPKRSSALLAVAILQCANSLLRSNDTRVSRALASLGQRFRHIQRLALGVIVNRHLKPQYFAPPPGLVISDRRVAASIMMLCLYFHGIDAERICGRVVR